MKKFFLFLKKINQSIDDGSDDLVANYAFRPLMLHLIGIGSLVAMLASFGIMVLLTLSFFIKGFGDHWDLKWTSLTLLPLWIFVFWSGLHRVRHSAWHISQRVSDFVDRIVD